MGKHKNRIFPDKNWCKCGEKQDYFNLCKRWRSLPATMARLTWLIHDQICIGDKTRNNVILSFLVRKKTIWKYLCVSYFSALLNWTQRTDSKKRRWKFPGRISLGYFPYCKKKKCLTWNISCCWQWPRREEGKCHVWSSWSRWGKPYKIGSGLPGGQIQLVDMSTIVMWIKTHVVMASRLFCITAT